jgi:hypothetical protein
LLFILIINISREMDRERITEIKIMVWHYNILHDINCVIVQGILPSCLVLDI